MYQVHEIIAFAYRQLRASPEYVKSGVRCNVFLCCAVLVVACGQHDPEQKKGVSAQALAPPTGGRTLTRGLLGEPRTLDPQIADDTYSYQVIRDIYEGLTAEDRDGGVVPGAAKSWTIDPTGTIYRFELRNDAKWSNGDPTTASEFVEGLRRAVDPKTASGSAALLSVIKGASDVTAARKSPSDLAVKAVGNFTVEIELEHPAPYILELLSQPIAFPVHMENGTSASVSPSPLGAITNGPYVLANRRPGSSIDLNRNKQYWDNASVAIDRIRYLIAESDATEEREYAAGQLDITFTLPAPDLGRARKQYNTQLQIAPILATLFLALDLSEPPLNGKPDIRQALSMAVDRELIAEHVVAGVTPAYTYVAKGIKEYISPQYSWVSWSRKDQVDYAKKLYEQSGYSRSHPLRLKLYFNRDDGIQRVMIAIAGSWKEHLGVESELVSEEFRVFLDGRKNKKRWDVARLGWTADYNDPTSFLDVFSPGNTQNDSGYISAPFNSSMASAEKETQPVRRATMLRQAEQTLLNDYPIVPIYFYNARRLVKPNVGGAAITPMNRTYSKHLFWKDAG